jgi:hypothetical protein
MLHDTSIEANTPKLDAAFYRKSVRRPWLDNLLLKLAFDPHGQ